MDPLSPLEFKRLSIEDRQWAIYSGLLEAKVSLDKGEVRFIELGKQIGALELRVEKHCGDPTIHSKELSVVDQENILLGSRKNQAVAGIVAGVSSLIAAILYYLLGGS